MFLEVKSDVFRAFFHDLEDLSRQNAILADDGWNRKYTGVLGFGLLKLRAHLQRLCSNLEQPIIVKRSTHRILFSGWTPTHLGTTVIASEDDNVICWHP